MVVSLAETDKEIRFMEKGVIGLALAAFLVTSAIIFVFVLRFVNRPIRKLIAGTERHLPGGLFHPGGGRPSQDEMGQLAAAMNFMCQEIGQKQIELNRQRDEYQNLFNTVPCIITVQDRDYRLLGYNREFAELFDPRPGRLLLLGLQGPHHQMPQLPGGKDLRGRAVATTAKRPASARTARRPTGW
ncbi:MAG: methyl-accepting chemotaxis protein [Desulfobacterales bacterium]|nr:methyl-accepting chemotaxis protein [Desulfobacterales bacterium]